MEAKDIYLKLRSISDGIHSYDDQLVAFAKWMEGEIESKKSKVEIAAPEMLETLRICNSTLNYVSKNKIELYDSSVINAIKISEQSIKKATE